MLMPDKLEVLDERFNKNRISVNNKIKFLTANARYSLLIQ